MDKIVFLKNRGWLERRGNVDKKVKLELSGLLALMRLALQV